MDFIKRSNLEGTHSFLSPSSPHWINYDEDKLDATFFRRAAAARGTALHALAHQLILLDVKLPDNGQTLSRYVNDAIGFRMTPEQVLFYSNNCYGHADCISFRNNKLRIHDLKTGVTETSMTQLEVYVALFCLEYKFKPFEIEIETRIYQNDDFEAHTPEPDVIFHIMDRIITYSRRIDMLRSEVA